MANQQLGFEVVGKSNASQVMGQAGKEADKLANKLKSAFDLKGALTNAFIGAFGAAALLNKSIEMISASFKGMADIADKSAKAGISGEEFDKLSYAAELAGVSTAVLSKSIRELRFLMKDALTDTSKMTLLTKGLGFAESDVREGKVKSIDLFQRVAQAIATQTTDTGKLAIATAFFGDKVANDMLPVLEQIAKHPDVFSGLVTGSEEAYAKLDAMDEKLQKLYRNALRLIGLSIFSGIKQNEALAADATAQSILQTISPQLSVASKFGAAFTTMGENKSGTATANADASKVNAQAIIDAQQKTVKNDNTIANSLGASMGNGPTSGVIGVGNNAQFTMMEQQLDTLKEIRDSIDRLGTPGYQNTDFTKPEYPTV
jgi:hypothetical protein